MLFDVSLLLVLIVFNGVLSLSEIAVVGSRRARLHQLSEEGSAGAARALQLAAELKQLLDLILVLLALGEQRLHPARVVQRDRLARLNRHQLRELIAEAVRQVEHPAA